METLELVLERAWPKAEYTIGKFYIDGVRYSESLEDTDRGLTSDMPLEEIMRIKVPGRTAIPKGRYEVVLTYSPRFHDRSWARKYNGLVPEIVGVPGYSGVRIHPFNWADESEGCISVGKNKVKGGVIRAVEFYTRLMDECFVPAKQIGKRTFITIK